MDLVKGIIEHGVYPAMELLKGNHIRANLKELKQSEKKTAEELRALQREKLKKLLLHCVEQVPAYRPYGALRELIRQDPKAALAQIPFTTKEDLRSHGDDYISSDRSKDSLIANRTGGSTGEPLGFYMDRYMVEYYEAARWRGLSWWGITPGSRSVMVWGNPFELSAGEQKKYQRKERWLKNRITISAYELSPEHLEETLRTIDSFRPEYLYGYATALTALAELMRQQGKRLRFRPKAIVSTSETLYPWQKTLLEEVFLCGVANEYGARDAGILAYSCPKGEMHLTAENAWIEFVDPITGKACAPGTIGSVVVTDLNNFCAPRLRYRLNDLSGWAEETACVCGRGLPLILPVEGREDSMFQRVDGGLVHGNAFNQAARSHGEILRFQIQQDAPDRAILRVVLRQEETGKAAADQLLAQAQELLPGTAIQLELCRETPKSASGKERYAIRNFPLKGEAETGK